MNVNGGLHVLLSLINRDRTLVFCGPNQTDYLIIDVTFSKRGLFQKVWTHYVIKCVGACLCMRCSIDLEANRWLPKHTKQNINAI